MPLASHSLLASAAGRRKVKAARRYVLVRCESCSATASAMVNAFGRITAVNLPAVRKTDQAGVARWFHANCKRGRLLPFDISESAA